MAKAADKIKTSTRKSYGKITGTHLARAKEQGYTHTAKGLADYMTKLANSGTITKSSWYKLRCAIASTQDYGGYKEAAIRLRALKFPAQATPKAKPKRAMIITDQDFKTLRDTVADKNDTITWAYLTLCRQLGCRPAEVQHVSELNGEFYVPSAKQRADGRGLDRFLTVNDPAALFEIRKAMGIIGTVEPLKRKTLHRVAQSRLNRTTAALWPRRERLPTLYTMRHQMGSDLKSSGLPPEEVAAVMGHQSTASASVYGYKVSGRGSVAVKPTGATVAKVRKVCPSSAARFNAQKTKTWNTRSFRP